MENCVFCKIISKEIQSNVVYEDEFLIAILDNDPISDGHTLVIPKKNIRNISELDTKTWNQILITIKEIIEILENDFGFEGTEIRSVSESFQDVPHLHFHVFGRNKSNDIKTIYPNIVDCNDKNLLQICERMKKKLT